MLWFSLYVTYAVIGWAIRAAMVTVVLRRQFAPGASVAWLGIVFLHPYIGLTLYLLVGWVLAGPSGIGRSSPNSAIPRETRSALRTK